MPYNSMLSNSSTWHQIYSKDFCWYFLYKEGGFAKTKSSTNVSFALAVRIQGFDDYSACFPTFHYILSSDK